MIHEGCYPCEHYAIVSSSTWSWSLTQDLFRWTLMLIQTLHQVGKIEVGLQARGCSRNWFPRQCSSSSLAYLGFLLWNHLNHDGIALSEFSINNCDPSGITRSWNPFDTSCRKSANPGFCKILEIAISSFLTLKSVVWPLSVFWQSSL